MRKYNNFVMLPPPPETGAHSKNTLKNIVSSPAENRLIKHTQNRYAR